MFPVMLDVQGQRCLVVGGGGVALRKVEGLLSDGAVVTVVAPEPMPALEEYAREGRIELQRRPYAAGEAGCFALVFTATDDREVNRGVSEDARARGIWVNSADDPELCTFHLPARVRRGPMQLAIASGGEAPFVVRRLRQLLERRFGMEWAEWVEAAGRFRRSVRDSGLIPSEQEACFDVFFSATVDPDRLSARVPSAAEEQAWLGSAAPDREHPAAPSRPAGTTRARQEDLPAGLVSLVGAGPGDAGLLTLRGRQRLLAADAIVYDRLAATSLPCDVPDRVELHAVGKTAGNHPVPQEEINSLLVRLARQGKRVVRLKGGDPFVFGRGSEEAEELARAGVPFEVVPCVTAGIAAPAYAGIPVTHRREAVRVTLVTAHESIKSEGAQVRWDLLAADPHATLLGYMGVTSLGSVVERLLQAGMDRSTPAAMIERGTTSGQRVVRSTICELPDAVTRAGLAAPALFVIGPTVNHADHLSWYSERALAGERLVLTAPAGRLGEALQIQGAEVVEVPIPLTPAARVVLGALPISGCVTRSANEIDVLDEERDRLGWGAETIAWCLNREAADRARARGWQHVEHLDDEATARDVVEAIGAARTARGEPAATTPRNPIDS